MEHSVYVNNNNVNPFQTHYYQPMWTLVGGGQKSLAQSARPMGSVLPKKAEWIKDSVAEFDPDRNVIVTKGGDEIAYEFLVVAIGMQLNYNAVRQWLP
jgi:NADH dehydrogenase FAD-containing subunit